MPTRNYVRFWCSKCQEFTLQELNGGPCKVCGTVTTSYKMSEVPEEKLIEQRERYNKKQRDSVMNVYSRSLLGLGGYDELMSMLSEPGSDINIREDDAGQKEIDEANQKRREERKLAREKLEAEYQLFKGTGRNEPCKCGSGLKYKKCCQSKYSKL